MSLIQCPNCEQEISEHAKKCPNCGTQLSKGSKYKKSIIIICVLSICLGLSAWGVWELRSHQLKKLTKQAEQCYSELDFEGVGECYQKMNYWFYDTTEKEAILEYDKKVCEDAKKYYDTLKKVDDSISKRSYSSLRSLLNTLKKPTATFSELEINKKSEIGQYINNIRNNIMYSTFNSQFVNNNEYDVDYRLTSGGYAMIITTYTSELLKEEFPYTGGN